MGKPAKVEPGDEHRVAGRLVRATLKPSDGLSEMELFWETVF